MGVELLDKTRKINKLLHNSNSTKVVFNDICEVLGETLSSNVLVISRKGKVLGLWNGEDTPVIGELLGGEVGSLIDPLLDNRLLDVLSTRENVDLRMFGFSVEGIEAYKAIINPIEIAGERLGTVFSYRDSASYDIDDIIVSEYGTTVVALAMVRSVDEETAHEQRLRGIVTSAFSTLSVSETEAIVHIFDELHGQEGILVASRVADRIGITRSVIVNALRKFESAGIIESRSSGMKGTYIKVLNPYVDEEIERVRLRTKTK
ncbi:MAG: GTP-sensing pleiotropic transcriptional regulator CodY [Lachnospiraceae bacterium]|nr:GTP-sensing pleiotropic transcriptional regulator CodY [Lachnospiraceae bacterium]